MAEHKNHEINTGTKCLWIVYGQYNCQLGKDCAFKVIRYQKLSPEEYAKKC